MANKPTVGSSNGEWGTLLNAFLDVGHDSDGTHTKTQMLTDMGWSPTAYAGEESITFPNGMILKCGKISRSGDDTTVTFDTDYTAFSAKPIILASCNDNGGSSSIGNDANISDVAKTGFTINCGTSAVDNYFWIAIGY